MIEIKNLTKTYHNHNQDFEGLKNVTLTLPDEGLIFITGESGNGKSTLLNVLSGLDSYDKGQILINGIDLNSLTDSEMFAYRANYSSFMFEDNNLIEDLNVIENIKLGAEFNGKKLSDDTITNILDVLKIGDKKLSKPNELSCGQRQRVCMARALIKEPKVFFVDEPSGHLDKENAELIWQVLKKLSEDILVVAVSHDDTVVKKYADRTIKLKEGKVDADSDPIPTTRIKSKDVKPMSFDRYGRIGNKNLMKLSFGNLKLRMFRSIICIVLSIVSLLMFSTFYILQSYDGYDVQANFTHESKVKYISFTDDGKITNEDYSKIYDKMSGYQFYKNTQTNLPIGIQTETNKHDPNTSKAIISSVMEVENVLIDGKNTFGQRLVYGAYPIEDKVSGIVVSDYIADLILKYGSYVKTTTEQESFKVLNSYNDFATHRIQIGEKTQYVYITGVYETNYKDYLNSDFELKKGADKTEYEYFYKNLYTVGHVKGGEDGFVNALVSSVNRIDNINIVITHATYGDVDLTAETFKKSDSLGGNKISIPYTVYNDIFKPETALNVDYFGGQDSKSIGDVFKDTGKSNTTIHISVAGGESKRYEIVSVNNTDSVFEVSADMFTGKPYAAIDETIYEGVVRDSMYPTTSVVVSTAKVKELSDMIRIMTNNGYEYSSLASEDIDDFTSKIETFSSALLVCAIITAVFSTVLMYTFINNIIEDRRKDNGLLLSLGATKGDIMKIFLMTAMMVAGTVFIGASLMTGVMSAILNSKAVTGLVFNIFNVNALSFLYTFGLTVLVVGIAVLVPMIQFSKRRPIQIMKDSKIR
ncbi:MAG: ATP-binding cassette domain-containing protein [Clostridia bacterium]|nr:ATP-binding cassette domain-containing protein [Clostridia bacterium]